MTRAREGLAHVATWAIFLAILGWCGWGIKWGLTTYETNKTFNRALENARAGRYDKAVEGFNEVLCREPDDAGALVLRGSVYGLKGDYSKAVEDFTEVLRLDPSNAKAYLDRSSAYAMMERYEQAITDMDEWIRRNPKDPEGYFLRALLHYKHDQGFTKVDEDLSACLRLDPDHLDAKCAITFRLAESVEAEGRYEQALETYERILELNPNGAGTYLVLFGKGRTLRSLGRITEAIETFARVLILQPNYAKAKDARRQALAALGENAAGDNTQDATTRPSTQTP